MRASALIALMLCGACTAFDDFGAFHFDAAVVTDGAAPDLTGGIAFGAACTANSCMQYNVARPVSCITQMMGEVFPDGMCTRTCIPGSAACSDYTDAVCAPVGSAAFCLPHCTGAMTNPCRTGYVCCVNGQSMAQQGQAGACTPQSSCH